MYSSFDKALISIGCGRHVTSSLGLDYHLTVFLYTPPTEVWLRPSTSDGHGWTDSTRPARNKHRIEKTLMHIHPRPLLLPLLLPLLSSTSSSSSSTSLQLPPLLAALQPRQPLWMTGMSVYVWDRWDEEHVIPRVNETFSTVTNFRCPLVLTTIHDKFIFKLKPKFCWFGPLTTWPWPVPVWYQMLMLCHQDASYWNQNLFLHFKFNAIGAKFLEMMRPSICLTRDRVLRGSTWAGFICWSSEVQSQRDLLFVWSAGSCRGSVHLKSGGGGSRQLVPTPMPPPPLHQTLYLQRELPSLDLQVTVSLLLLVSLTYLKTKRLLWGQFVPLCTNAYVLCLTITQKPLKQGLVLVWSFSQRWVGLFKGKLPTEPTQKLSYLSVCCLFGLILSVWLRPVMLSGPQTFSRSLFQ